MKKLIEKMKHFKWDIEEYIEKKLERFCEDEDESEDEGIYYSINKKEWESIILSVKSNGYEYYEKQINKWLEISLNENDMLTSDQKEPWNIYDIEDAYTMKKGIRLIYEGYYDAALQMLSDELDIFPMNFFKLMMVGKV